MQLPQFLTENRSALCSNQWHPRRLAVLGNGRQEDKDPKRRIQLPDARRSRLRLSRKIFRAAQCLRRHEAEGWAMPSAARANPQQAS
jgi:hypothetical protein